MILKIEIYDGNSWPIIDLNIRLYLYLIDIRACLCVVATFFNFCEDSSINLCVRDVFDLLIKQIKFLVMNTICNAKKLICLLEIIFISIQLLYSSAKHPQPGYSCAKLWKLMKWSYKISWRPIFCLFYIHISTLQNENNIKMCKKLALFHKIQRKCLISVNKVKTIIENWHEGIFQQNL